MSVTVTDGDTVEACEITEEYEHRGDTFARVEGETLSGWVEL